MNFNGGAYIGECLEALAASTHAPAAVVVVDNASADGSADLVARRFPSVVVVRRTHNVGFAAAANGGIRRCLDSGHDAVLLLNPDAFVSPDALQSLAAVSAGHPHALLGPMIVLDRDPARTGTAGTRISWWRGRTVRPLPVAAAGAADVAVDALSGCSLWIPRGAVDALGGLDEAYFLYFEDLDYSVRARAAGWQLWIATGALVRHRESLATGGRTSPLAMYYFVRNRHRFVRERARRRAAFVAYETTDVLSRIAVSAARGRGAMAAAVWQGWIDGWRGRTGPR